MGSKCFRSYEEQLPYFDGLEMVEPGFVPASKWRPSSDFPTRTTPPTRCSPQASAESRRPDREHSSVNPG